MPVLRAHERESGDSRVKKVAIFISSLQAGGAERIVSYLLREAAGRFEVYLILLKNRIDYPLPRSPSIKLVELGSGMGSKILGVLGIPWLARRLRRYLEKEGIETMLSLLNRPNLITCFAKGSGWKGKAIISERTNTLDYYESIRFGALMLWLIRRYYPKADVVTVISKGIARNLSAMGIKDAQVIYNPIYVEQKTRKPRAASPFTFIHVARLEPYKNQSLLLRAFAGIRDSSSRLIIVGDGSLSDVLKGLAVGLAIGDRVEFAGYQEDVPSWLEKSDCMIFSSDFEGFGNVILEAMNAGIPVISTDCPFGPREILAPSTDPRHRVSDRVEVAEFGVLTPVKSVVHLTNAMEEMMENSELRARYQLSGPRRVADFDIKKISEQYFQLF